MNVKATKRFLHISNIIIALLCLTAILGYFILPLWKIDFSFTLTPALVDEIAKSYETASVESTREIGYASSTTGKYSYVDETNNGAYLSEKDIVLAVAKAMAKSDLTLSMSGSFDTSTFVGAVFDRSPDVIEEVIDKTVEKLASDAEVIVSDVIDTVAKTVAKEVVKSQIKDFVIDSIEAGIDDDILSITGISEDRVDQLVETVISAIMADDATITSVTDIMMSVSDEVIELLAESEKYAEDAAKITDEDRATIRDKIIETISPYADEEGRINLKEALVTQVINLANDALPDDSDSDQAFKTQKDAPKAAFAAVRLNSKGSGKLTYTDNLSGVTSSPLSYNDAVAKLKSKLKTMLLENLDDSVLNSVMVAVAVVGVIVLILLIMLAYPIIRALTKIGSKNPGFHLALPIIAGIIPFLLMVVIPNAFISIAKSGTLLSSFGSTGSASVVLDAFTVTFSSGTFIAFIVALVLFVYSFVYGHYRRKLKKALTEDAAQEETAPSEISPAPAADTSEIIAVETASDVPPSQENGTDQTN